MKLAAIYCSIVCILLAAGTAAAQSGSHLLRRQIRIENIEYYPRVVFFAVIRDTISREAVDLYVFPMSGAPLENHYPAAFIEFYWMRLSEYRAACGTEALRTCFLRVGETPFRRFEGLEESTDIWLPDSDPRFAERTDYAVAVNLRSGLNLYVSRRSYSFTNGRPLQIETYRKPVARY